MYVTNARVRLAARRRPPPGAVRALPSHQQQLAAPATRMPTPTRRSMLSGMPVIAAHVLLSTEGSTKHEICLLCDDLEATIAELRAQGIEFRGERR